MKTAEEFEKGYAERSGLSVERLRELGFEPVPCQCGEEGCLGWRMRSEIESEEIAAMRSGYYPLCLRCGDKGTLPAPTGSDGQTFDVLLFCSCDKGQAKSIEGALS